MLGVKIAVVRAGDADFHSRDCNLLEDITRAAGVVIRSDDDQLLPAMFASESNDGGRGFDGVVRVIGKQHNLVFWHAAFDQVVLHQFADSRVGADPTAAGHYYRSRPLPEQFGSLGCAVS